MAIRMAVCHGNVFNLIKGMQMVQNKKIAAGLALIAGLVGMGASGAASALPEMDVGSVSPIVAPDSLNTHDGTVAEPADTDAQANAS